MSYHLSLLLSDCSMEAAIARLRPALQTEGFGIITEIDMQETMKQKLNASVTPYKILGACHPQLALRGLQLEERIGVFMPCNVVVRAVNANDTEICAVDPVATLGTTGDPELIAFAGEVREKLSRALKAL